MGEPLTFTLSLNFDIQDQPQAQFDFQWNVGSSTLYYYNVSGKCIGPTPSNSNFDPNDPNCKPNPNGKGTAQFLRIVAATSVANVCKQLKSQFLVYPMIWPIQSIKKQSRPVYLTDVADQAAGIDDTTLVLIDQEWRSVPECLEFTILEAPQVSMAMSTYVYSNFFSYTGAGTIHTGGSANTNRTKYYLGSGSMNLHGDATSRKSLIVYKYVGSGSLLIPPTHTRVVSSHWHYVGSGNMVLSGAYNNRYRYLGSGNAALSGSAGASVYSVYFGSGNMVLSGRAHVVSSAFRYVGSGNMILASPAGGTPIVSTYLGVFNVHIVSSQDVMDLMAVYAPPDASQNIPLAPPTSTVTTPCDCRNLPLVLNLSQNILAGESLFSSFLKRNGLSLPDFLPIRYSRSNLIWKNNFSFVGTGVTNETEKWTILFEWGCQTASIENDLENPDWRFLLSVNSLNMASGLVTSTRILYVLSIDPICVSDKFSILMSLNTQTGSLSVPQRMFVNTILVRDNLGLFMGPDWASTPNLNVEITEQVLDPNPGTFNISPYLPPALGKPEAIYSGE
jgi:hypothetical protein